MEVLQSVFIVAAWQFQPAVVAVAAATAAAAAATAAAAAQAVSGYPCDITDQFLYCRSLLHGAWWCRMSWTMLESLCGKGIAEQLGCILTCCVWLVGNKFLAQFRS